MPPTTRASALQLTLLGLLLSLLANGPASAYTEKENVAFIDKILALLNNNDDCQLPTYEEITEVKKSFDELEAQYGSSLEARLTSDQRLIRSTVLDQWESFEKRMVEGSVVIRSAKKRSFLCKIEQYQKAKYGDSICTAIKQKLGPKSERIFEKNPLVRYIKHLETHEIIEQPAEPPVTEKPGDLKTSTFDKKAPTTGPSTLEIDLYPRENSDKDLTDETGVVHRLIGHFTIDNINGPRQILIRVNPEDNESKKDDADRDPLEDIPVPSSDDEKLREEEERQREAEEEQQLRQQQERREREEEERQKQQEEERKKQEELLKKQEEERARQEVELKKQEELRRLQEEQQKQREREQRERELQLQREAEELRKQKEQREREEEELRRQQRDQEQRKVLEDERKRQDEEGKRLEEVRKRQEEEQKRQDEERKRLEEERALQEEERKRQDDERKRLDEELRRLQEKEEAERLEQERLATTTTPAPSFGFELIDDTDLERLVRAPRKDWEFDPIYDYFKWPDENPDDSQSDQLDASVLAQWAEFTRDPEEFDRIHEAPQKLNPVALRRRKKEFLRALAEENRHESRKARFGWVNSGVAPATLLMPEVNRDRWLKLADNNFCKVDWNRDYIPNATKRGYKAVKSLFVQSEREGISRKRRLIS